MELGDRFWDRIDAGGDCWEWTAGTGGGYGRFCLDGKTQMAHRLAWEALVGPIPEGLQIDHLCRNKRCVNPDHLEPVTCQENLRRGFNHNSNRRECPKGHPYGEGNTYIRPNGRRYCRTCHAEQVRARRALAATVESVDLVATLTKWGQPARQEGQ